MKTSKKKTRRRPSLNLCVAVRISYPLGIHGTDDALETKLEKIAEASHGKDGDSGAGFGRRDLYFLFYTLGAAEQFIKDVRRVRRVQLESVDTIGWAPFVRSDG